MASAVERLKFVLSVDADGAIKSFEKVGNTAEKELRRAETSMQKVGGQLTKFGAGATAAAGIAGVALFSMSKKFQDAALEADKLSKATGLTTEQASRWVDVANDAGVETATFEGALGKMTKLLGTSSAKFDELGIATADASGKTLSANDIFLNSVEVLNGISDPFVRAKAASDIFGRGFQGIAELTGKSADDLRARLASVGDAQIYDETAVADAHKYQDSLNDLSDAFNQLTLSIGKGAAPVFGMLADAITGAVNGFNKLDGLTGGAVGKFAAIATVGVAVVGSISMVAGSVAKMSARFKAGEEGLNRFGKTAAAVGTGMAILGGTIAGIDVIDKIIGRGGGASLALNELFGVMDKGKGNNSAEYLDKVASSFAHLQNQTEGKTGTFDRFTTILGEGLDKAAIAAEYARKAFSSVLETSPEAAQSVIDAMRVQTAAAAQGDAQAQEFIDGAGITNVVLDEMQKQLDGVTGKSDYLAQLTGGLTVEEQKAADALKETTTALEDEAAALLEAADALREKIDAQRSAADAVYALRDAQDTFTESLENTDQAIADADGNANKIAAVYRDIASNAADVADGTIRVYEEQLAANGITLDAVTGMDLWNNSMLTAAGTARGEARSAIIEFLALRNNIPPELMTDIRAAVDAGDLKRAEWLLAAASVTRGVALVADADTVQAKKDLDAAAAARTTTIVATVKPGAGFIGPVYDPNWKPQFGPPAPVKPQFGPPAPTGGKGAGGAGGADGKGAPGKATGGITAPGVTLVGEQGPELVIMAGGERVLTAAQTKNVSSGAGSSANNDQQMWAAQLEMGDITAAKYKELLSGRLGTLQKYSSEYMSVWREIRGIDRDTANETEAQQNAMFQMGEISADFYKQILKGRLGTQKKYSSEYMSTLNEIRNIERDSEQKSKDNMDFAQRFKEAATQKHLDRVRAMYQKASDQRSADDARDTAERAVRDYAGSMSDAYKVGADRKSTQQDRQSAIDSATSAATNAANALLDRAGSAAVVAGFDEGTPEWARYVRAALLQDERNAPGLTSAIDRVLTGIPQLARGGLVTAPTVALIGEAGPEAVVPLSNMGAMGATYNITVNTGADPNSVVAAIKRYTKNGGVL